MKVLGLVPARGGSKGIPRKNIKPIAGKPLIAWTIEAALRSPLLATVVVTTEDAEIADVARQHGAQTPFLRPAELARDETPGVDPALHALRVLPDYDAVLLLQSTSPLRNTADIDGCLQLAEKLNAPSVVSVCQAERHPYWMYLLGSDQHLQTLIPGKEITRRQDLPPVYAANGALYFARTPWLQQHRAFITPETVGYVMPNERSVDLDTMLDWKLAELLLKEQEGE